MTNIICKRCVLDKSIEEITFNSEGICNFCDIHDSMEKNYPIDSNELNKIINKIKNEGRNKKYDCILGVSGGRDSTYTLLKAVEFGLRPLAVHFDNGWNSKIAVKNIKNATDILGVDLETIVADWNEFRDLQVSFLKASVSDGEVPTDWVIFSVLFKIAKREKLKYIIHGHSFRTEGSTPLSWTYMDGKYVKSIHKIFGKSKIKSFPIMSMFDYIVYSLFYRIKQFRILYYLEYNEKEVINRMKEELKWEDYGGKHFESSYTSIYQSFVLMRKFKIDKRKLHYSALIRNNQLKRSKALNNLKKDPFIGGKNQISYTIKKLGLTEYEFQKIMNEEIRSFKDYPSYYNLIQFLETPIKYANKLKLIPDVVINKYYNLKKK